MITSRTIALGILKAVVVLTIIIASALFLFKIQSVIIYIIISFILTMIGNPILWFFKNKFKLNNTFATISTLLIFYFNYSSINPLGVI